MAGLRAGLLAPDFAGRYAGYFEAHIEQGRRLDASGDPGPVGGNNLENPRLRVGVETGIVGYRLFRHSTDSL